MFVNRVDQNAGGVMELRWAGSGQEALKLYSLVDILNCRVKNMFIQKSF